MDRKKWKCFCYHLGGFFDSGISVFLENYYEAEPSYIIFTDII